MYRREREYRVTILGGENLLLTGGFLRPELSPCTYRIDGRVDVAEVIGEIPQRLGDPLLQLKSLQHGQHAEIYRDVKPQHYHQISSMLRPVGGPGDDERQQDGRQGLGRLPILRGEIGFYVGVFNYFIEISSFNSHTRAVTHHFHRPFIRKP